MGWKGTRRVRVEEGEEECVKSRSVRDQKGPQRMSPSPLLPIKDLRYEWRMKHKRRPD